MAEPWVTFEDEHLLVVVKPAGVNTHRSGAHAQDGMHEWVQRQRPDTPLAILHRLDKATSGLLAFGKSTLANRSLAAQFEARSVRKGYDLLVESNDAHPAAVTCEKPIEGTSRGDLVALPASTDFERRAAGVAVDRYVAHPHTGRTHQVRIHAAALGMPILGDVDHGGAEAARVFLHAAHLGVEHPVRGSLDLTAQPPASFDLAMAATAPATLRAARLRAQAAVDARTILFDPIDTDAYLCVDRHHDGFPDIRVERLGDVALVVRYDGERELPAEWLSALQEALQPRSMYELRRLRGGSGGAARVVAGAPQPRFEVVEVGLRYCIDLEASATSTGLFLDQRETRRRLRSLDLSGRSVLNAFAHTGSLSVAAAAAGAETVTLDLSKRYLDWARANLRANDIDVGDHDFIYGDALDWMQRLAKRGRRFDVVLVDPPSTSTTRRPASRWAVERDLHVLVERAAGLCDVGGTIYVSTNLRRMSWDRFLEHVRRGLAAAGRTGDVTTATVPLDHRTGPGDPPYLKAAWIALDT